MPNPVSLLGTGNRVVRPMFRGLAIAASGLEAERFRMEIAAQNISNAETVDSTGKAYQRQFAVLNPGNEATVDGGSGNVDSGLNGSTSDPFLGIRAGMLGPMGSGGMSGETGATIGISGADAPRRFPVPVIGDSVTGPQLGPQDGLYGVQVQGVAVDQAAGALVYDPGNPAANAQGYVQMPNVNMTEETVNLMEARRSYDANASVFESIKASLKRALEI